MSHLAQFCHSFNYFIVVSNFESFSFFLLKMIEDVDHSCDEVNQDRVYDWFDSLSSICLGITCCRKGLTLPPNVSLTRRKRDFHR